MSPRRLWLIAALSLVIVVGAGAGAIGFVRYRDRQFQTELREAVGEFEAGRLASARDRLTRLVALRADHAEALYQLGLCELARGNNANAVAAWSRISPGNRFSIKAGTRRAQILIDSGRLAEAESILEALPRTDDVDGRLLRQTLELLYRVEGRDLDVRRLVLESWNNAPAPDDVLRRVYLLDNSAYPVDMFRDILSRGLPSDPRVCLGRANLALHAGKFDEASRWLYESLKKRPDDPPALRTALALGMATEDMHEIEQAMYRLTEEIYSPSEQIRLRVWLASHQGNAKAELEALHALVALKPSEIAAWDRLAELAILKGDSTEAERLRKKKAEINALRARYKTLIDRDERISVSGQLAELATKLGRSVEARGWQLIHDGKARTEPLLATNGTRTSEKKAPQTLDMLLSDFREPVRNPLGLSLADLNTPLFVDEAAEKGLAFVYDNGHNKKQPPPPEAMGGGVALLDYDGDGWLDAYLVQGGPFPAGQSSTQEGDRLFRNKGDGSFEDATERSGISGFGRGYGHGVTVGDFDNDGHPDLLVTRWRSYALYRNKGDGAFEDVTEKAGLSGNRDWPTSAAFADLDNDGDLDLYVCHYLAYDETNPRRCEHPDAPSRHGCNPLDFDALPDHVFRNDGGRFVDVTEASGMLEHAGRGLGVVAADLDGDGRIDLYVANDMSANYLYRNLGGFKFEEVGMAAGAAASAEGGYKAGMGIACGDLDGDGRVDLAVTNYYGESTTYYRNLGAGNFADHTDAIGLSAPTRLLLGFGISFLDANNDGRLDVLSANGHVLDNRPNFPWMMPLQLLQGGANGRLIDLPDCAGAPFGPLHLGRGFAAGDLDHDGRVDALVVCQNEPLVYLHNQTKRGDKGHFVVLGLEGKESNRDAIGAVVVLRSGPKSWVVPRLGGGNYQSSGDPRIHIGMGEATRVEEVEVTWPSGRVDRHKGLEADTGHLLREGAEKPAPLKGWTRISVQEPPARGSTNP